MTPTTTEVTAVTAALTELVSELVSIGHSYDAQAKSRNATVAQGDLYRATAEGIDIALGAIRRRIQFL